MLSTALHYNVIHSDIVGRECLQGWGVIGPQALQVFQAAQATCEDLAMSLAGISLVELVPMRVFLLLSSCSVSSFQSRNSCQATSDDTPSLSRKDY